MGIIVLCDILGEVSGDVRVDYVVSDVEGDSVRLRVEKLVFESENTEPKPISIPVT